MRQPIIVSIVHEHGHRLQEQSIAIAVANLRRVSAVAAIVSPRFVANLSNRVVASLGINTTVRMVRVSPGVLQHIFSRRKEVSEVDVDLAVGGLGECIEHVEFVVHPQRPGKHFELVAFVPSKQRHLRVPLKFVPAIASKANEDEWWVQTAIPFRGDIDRAIANGRLRRL